MVSDNTFNHIREWAAKRGIYDSGDAKTQALKLVEEVGELAKATIENDHEGFVDSLGDCVVVLVNLAQLKGIRLEDAINHAYNEISNRKGRMENGTFIKDEI